MKPLSYKKVVDPVVLQARQEAEDYRLDYERYSSTYKLEKIVWNQPDITWIWEDYDRYCDLLISGLGKTLTREFIRLHEKDLLSRYKSDRLSWIVDWYRMWVPNHSVEIEPTKADLDIYFNLRGDISDLENWDNWENTSFYHIAHLLYTKAKNKERPDIVKELFKEEGVVEKLKEGNYIIPVDLTYILNYQYLNRAVKRLEKKKVVKKKREDIKQFRKIRQLMRRGMSYEQAIKTIESEN